MSYEYVQVAKTEHITTVTLNRPEVMNALHPYAGMELQAVFDEFAADKSQWVAIVTGAGTKAFCAGNDLKFQAEHGSEKVQELRRGLPAGFGGLARRCDCFKPHGFAFPG